MSYYCRLGFFQIPLLREYYIQGFGSIPSQSLPLFYSTASLWCIPLLSCFLGRRLKVFSLIWKVGFFKKKNRWGWWKFLMLYVDCARLLICFLFHYFKHRVWRLGCVLLRNFPTGDSGMVGIGLEAKQSEHDLINGSPVQVGRNLAKSISNDSKEFHR